MDANEWVNLIGNIANTATGVASNVIDVVNGSTSGTSRSSVSYVQPQQQTQSFQIPRAAWYVGAAIGGLLLIKAIR